MRAPHRGCVFLAFKTWNDPNPAFGLRRNKCYLGNCICCIPCLMFYHWFEMSSSWACCHGDIASRSQLSPSIHTPLKQLLSSCRRRVGHLELCHILPVFDALHCGKCGLLCPNLQVYQEPPWTRIWNWQSTVSLGLKSDLCFNFSSWNITVVDIVFFKGDKCTIPAVFAKGFQAGMLEKMGLEECRSL